MSGWPVNVDYLDFEDVKNKDLSGYDVIINAGFAGSAWSGAEYWKDSKAVTALRSYAWNGGCILGDKSAVYDRWIYDQFPAG